jgi:Domain of unknown function (DUF4124)
VQVSLPRPKVTDMSRSSTCRNVSTIALFALWASSALCADVYKWVDERGQTHYSQRKDAVAKTKTVQLKVSAPQPSASTPAAILPHDSGREWKGSPVGATRPAEVKPVGPRVTSEPRSDAIETNASKCKLARDVLSGAVEHSNGARTDAYDRQVAESDIRLFCGK